MKVHTLWIVSVALGLSACGPREPAESEPPESDPAAPPAQETQAIAAEVDDAFIDHMHAHAERLDDLMFALADDDLEGAGTPAYWLSQHEAVAGIPEEWRHYVTAMRNAAYDVETAQDLDTARVAAEAISAQCQACHAAAGSNAFE